MNDIATAESGAPAPLLDVRDLNVTFDVGRGAAPFRAVDGVTLTVGARETVGVVGESGSGKSTLGRAVLGLVPVASGSIAFEGTDITHAGGRERRALSEDLQVIFQDPYSSLNPARSIGQTLGETMRVHQRVSADAVDDRVRTMLGKVGLQPEYADRFPSQFSGGQRQRIAIARALMAQPKLVICDEAVSALDLSIQAQVLNLLSDLQAEFELSYLFIAHDLAVVRHASHRIVVLYAGRIMEEGPAATVCDSPAHPYTRALLESAPVLDPIAQRRRRDERARLRAASRVPAAADPSSACPFAPRCPHAVELCTTVRPPAERTDDGSTVACHRWRDIAKHPTGAAAAAAPSPTHRPAPASPAR